MNLGQNLNKTQLFFIENTTGLEHDYKLLHAAVRQIIIKKNDNVK